MKAASTAVQNYLNALRSNPDIVAIVADCYTFTLRTGLILTYTNADVPVNSTAIPMLPIRSLLTACGTNPPLASRSISSKSRSARLTA